MAIIMSKCIICGKPEETRYYGSPFCLEHAKIAKRYVKIGLPHTTGSKFGKRGDRHDK
jgi:hypothetical protein